MSKPKATTWAYGVTTVPVRRHTLLPRTLESLKAGGFDEPRLFVDGAEIPDEYCEFGLPITLRSPALRAYGNWVLALWELWVRLPGSDYYAIFQDDIVMYRNLRQYLDRCDKPEKGYWNLFTMPKNHQLVPDEGSYTGWYLSNQMGKGGLGLVFTLNGVLTLLSSYIIAQRPLSATRGHKSLDGGVVTAMKKAHFKEYVHCPSLVQHTGRECPTISPGSRHPLAPAWRGEDFDAMELLG